MSSGAAFAVAGLIAADFEQAGFSGWKNTGVAIGTGPGPGPVDGQMAVDGFLGNGDCNSFHGGDDTTGSLVPPPFKITRKYHTFLIVGGGFAGKTCINLTRDCKVGRTATGPNTKPGGTELLDWQFWDVSELKGQDVVMEIVDQATGGWGALVFRDRAGLPDSLLQIPGAPQGSRRRRSTAAHLPRTVLAFFPESLPRLGERLVHETPTPDHRPAREIPDPASQHLP